MITEESSVYVDICTQLLNGASIQSSKTLSDCLKDLGKMVDVLRHSGKKVFSLSNIELLVDVEPLYNPDKYSLSEYLTDLTVVLALLPVIDFRVHKGTPYVRWNQNIDPDKINPLNVFGE